MLVPETFSRKPRLRSRATPWPRLPLPRSLRWAGLLVVLLGTWLVARPAPLPSEALVAKVIDGDTVKLVSGQLVRYVGVDTPETRRRHGGTWVAAQEPFGQEATTFNRELVEGKSVRLEYDAQPRDRYGRLLAYVYVGDTFVNAALLQQGYGEVMVIRPNDRYAEEFRALAKEAREAQRGLWAGKERRE